MNGKRKGWFKKKGADAGEIVSGATVNLDAGNASSYNGISAGYWDGIGNNYVEINSPPVRSSTHFYEFKCNLSEFDDTHMFVGFDSGGLADGFYYQNSIGAFRYSTSGASGGTLAYAPIDSMITLRVERVNTQVTIKVNGSTIGTLTTDSTTTAPKRIGISGSFTALRFKGIMYDINYNDEIFIANPSTGNAVDSIGGYALTESGTIEERGLWFDLTANNYDATLVNGVLYDSANGGILTFDGINDYVEGNTGYSVSTLQPFTIEVWFKTDVTANDFDIIVQTKTNQVDSFNLHLTPPSQFTSYGTITFGGRVGFDQMKITTTISNSSWYQVIITYQGSSPTSLNSYKLYLNGVGQTILSSGIYGTSTNVNTLGSQDTTTRFLEGSLPIFNLYNNKEFNQTEVTQNFDFYKSRFGL